MSVLLKSYFIACQVVPLFDLGQALRAPEPERLADQQALPHPTDKSNGGRKPPTSVKFVLNDDGSGFGGSAARIYRGRNAGYPAPPAPIRTSPIRASGSYLGCLAAKRTEGQG